MSAINTKLLGNALPSSANDIYGQIGAAKAFSSSVSKIDSEKIEKNEEDIAFLESQLKEIEANESAGATSEEMKQVNNKKKKDINKKIKRLRRQNTLLSAGNKMAKGATDFLTKIMNLCDIGIDFIITWLANFCVTFLPALEVATKAAILANIKKMLSCAIDPGIPDSWRTQGELFDEQLIDPRAILDLNPYEGRGKYAYFGVFGNKDYKEDDNSTRSRFELARAEDMDAFMWFVKTYGKFVSPNLVTDRLDSIFKGLTPGATLYNTHYFEGNGEYVFDVGSSFKHYQGSTITFLCERKFQMFTDDNKDSSIYTIVPVTDRFTGATWYKDTSKMLDTYLDNPYKNTSDRKTIDYDKSKGLFNLEYQASLNRSGLLPNGTYKFSILPKPFSTGGGYIVDLENNANTLLDMANSGTQQQSVFGNDISGGTDYKFSAIQSPIPKVARFDYLGHYNKKGKYSIDINAFDVVQVGHANGYIDYNIYRASDITHSDIFTTMKFDTKKKVFGIEDADDLEKMSELLTECYFGQTVYEFNYDYVMSMKLFDAKSIASNIVTSLMNFRFRKDYTSEDEDVSPVTDTERAYIDNYINRLVEKMIETEDYEFTNCFYEFDNQEYDNLEKKTADNVINGTLINDVSSDSVEEIFDIIDSYTTDATLKEQTETLTRAFTKAANAIGVVDGTAGTRSYTGDSVFARNENGYGQISVDNFIENAVKILTTEIVYAVLTPKVLLLIQVNKRLMGEDALTSDKKFTLEDVLNGLSGVLKGVIRTIIDEIQKELLRMILEKLSEIMASYIKRLGAEYAMKWTLIIKQLLACFKSNKSNMVDSSMTSNNTTSTINSILDQVDYADIDTLVDEIIPNTNPC